MTMELKDALELVIASAIEHGNRMYEMDECGLCDKITDAVIMVRDGGEKAEDVIEEIEAQKCSKCGLPNIGCHTTCKCGNFMGFSRWKDMVKWSKTYTTQNELKIIEVTSDPVFVEIGDEE